MGRGRSAQARLTQAAAAFCAAMSFSCICKSAKVVLRLSSCQGMACRQHGGGGGGGSNHGLGRYREGNKATHGLNQCHLSDDLKDFTHTLIIPT